MLPVSKINVTLDSLSDIMFDKFIDHSKEVRPPEQKLYISDGDNIVIPSENVHTFLFGEVPGGCAKTFEGKKGKDYIRTGQGHIVIEPVYIPFLNPKDKIIKYKGFDKDDSLYVYEAAGRTKMGSLSIKQEIKPRPVLRHPWKLDFSIMLVENTLIDENKLYNWFCKGGLLVALGTYRPRFGRFTVSAWDVTK